MKGKVKISKAAVAVIGCADVKLVCCRGGRVLGRSGSSERTLCDLDSTLLERLPNDRVSVTACILNCFGVQKSVLEQTHCDLVNVSVRLFVGRFVLGVEIIRCARVVRPRAVRQEIYVVHAVALGNSRERNAELSLFVVNPTVFARAVNVFNDYLLYLLVCAGKKCVLGGVLACYGLGTYNHTVFNKIISDLGIGRL